MQSRLWCRPYRARASLHSSRPQTLEWRTGRIKMIPKWRWLCVGWLAVIALGCGGERVGDTGNKPGSKGTIGVSVLTMRNPFFKVIADNITAEAKKAGYDTIITDGDMKVDEQRRQVQDFIV